MAEFTDRPQRDTPEHREPERHGEHRAPERHTADYPEHETRRATGMGNPGRFPDEHPMEGEHGEEMRAFQQRRSDGAAESRVRLAAGDRISDVSSRVRHLGEAAADRNRFLAPTRPLARGAAEGLDTAAEYVRTHPVSEMRGDLESEVRRHPLAAIAVAFLAGYTLRRIF